MAIKVGINGFGRIGRNILRAALNEQDLDFVAVNDITSTDTLAHLLKYDSVLGNLSEPVSVEGDTISVRQKSHKNAEIALAAEGARVGSSVGWLEVDLDKLSGTVTRAPMREDIDIEIQEQLIVELYSK